MNYYDPKDGQINTPVDDSKAAGEDATSATPETAPAEETDLPG